MKHMTKWPPLNLWCLHVCSAIVITCPHLFLFPYSCFFVGLSFCCLLCYHVFYLAFVHFDYGYNMKFNVAIGELWWCEVRDKMLCELQKCMKRKKSVFNAIRNNDLCKSTANALENVGSLNDKKIADWCQENSRLCEITRRASFPSLYPTARRHYQSIRDIEITSWKARAYGIFTRVGEVSDIERVSAAIVNGGDWLWNPANFKAACYCYRFCVVTWYWPCTVRTRQLLYFRAKEKFITNILA